MLSLSQPKGIVNESYPVIRGQSGYVSPGMNRVPSYGNLQFFGFLVVTTRRLTVISVEQVRSIGAQCHSGPVRALRVG